VKITEAQIKAGVAESNRITGEICELIDGKDIDAVMTALSGVLVSLAIEVGISKDSFLGGMAQTWDINRRGMN
jgi:hypothetical protein